MIKGIDVSKWQGSIDFAKASKEVSFVIMKASEGVGFVDPQFLNYQTGARKAGLLTGYYHFARPDLGNKAEDEADFFLKTIGEIKNGEVLCLDFEVSYNQAVTWCKRWLDRISSQLQGYKPLIYLNFSLTKSYDWSAVSKADYGLWLAWYNEGLPQVPWPVVAFQQNSSQGTVSGVPARVDTDVFYGDVTSFKKYGVKVTDPCQDKIDSLNAEIQRLKDQKFSVAEVLALLIRSIKSGY